MAKRRDWHDIVAEILETARDGKLKTHIMFKARLSHDQVNKYLPFLIDKDLIENLTVKKKKISMKLYRTTQKGIKLMEILESVKRLEDSPTEEHESRGTKPCSNLQKRKGIKHISKIICRESCLG